LFGQGICNFHIVDALHLQEQEMIISMHYICKNTTSSTQQIEVLENRDTVPTHYIFANTTSSTQQIEVLENRVVEHNSK
jgi:L-ascorbate metabolism protein UlaG (beta-lactamase superfamily)